MSNGKYFVGMLGEAIIKIVIVALAVVVVYRGASSAYDFGYRVFADEPVSQSGGRTITVAITEDQSVQDIGNMLEEKGLIKDAKLFYVQELLSAYHDEIVPGIYDLSTAMKAEEILQTISPKTDASTTETDLNQDSIATDSVSVTEDTDDNQ